MATPQKKAFARPSTPLTGLGALLITMILKNIFRANQRQAWRLSEVEGRAIAIFVLLRILLISILIPPHDIVSEYQPEIKADTISNLLGLIDRYRIDGIINI